MTIQNGKKFDENKLRWDLLPMEPVEESIKVLMHGAKKYGDNNWRKLDHPKERYYNALMRHIGAWWRGETLDEESGLSHLAHAMVNMIFLLEFDKLSLLNEKLKVKKGVSTYFPIGTSPNS